MRERERERERERAFAKNSSRPYLVFVQFIIAAIKEAEECPTSSENRFGEVLLGF